MRWHVYSGGTEKIIEASGVYGVVQIPEKIPTMYASIDLCEVLRQTRATLRTVEEVSPGVVDRKLGYAEGLSVCNDVVPVVQTLMANGLVPPVDDLDKIVPIMQGWKRSGVYIFANTSTLPGCEIPTIDFLEEYLPGIFSGILLPRNHDGTLPATKGTVARDLLEYLGAAGGSIPATAIHIDDLSHHTEDFRRHVGGLPNVRVETFQPVYPYFSADPGSVISQTPLQAFEQADRFLFS